MINNNLNVGPICIIIINHITHKRRRQQKKMEEEYFILGFSTTSFEQKRANQSRHTDASRVPLMLPSNNDFILLFCYYLFLVSKFDCGDTWRR